MGRGVGGVGGTCLQVNGSRGLILRLKLPPLCPPLPRRDCGADRITAMWCWRAIGKRMRRLDLVGREGGTERERDEGKEGGKEGGTDRWRGKGRREG